MGRDTGTPRAEWNGDCDERADTQAASAARRDEAVGARKLLEAAPRALREERAELHV